MRSQASERLAAIQMGAWCVAPDVGTSLRGYGGARWGKMLMTIKPQVQFHDIAALSARGLVISRIGGIRTAAVGLVWGRS